MVNDLESIIRALVNFVKVSNLDFAFLEECQNPTILVKTLASPPSHTDVVSENNKAYKDDQ